MHKMDFQTFTKRYDISLERICRDIFRSRDKTIRIKKEETAVKNLTLILDAALNLSVEKGFDAMTLRDLQSRSGLSMGCLYSYFSGKEALLHLMQYQGRNLVRDVLHEVLKDEAIPQNKLEIAIRAHLYLSERMHKWFYFSYMETKNLGREEARKAIESELLTEAIFVDILDEGKQKGVFFFTDARLVAAIIKAMLQDWYLKRWKYKKRQIGVEEYAAFLITFTGKALGHFPSDLMSGTASPNHSSAGGEQI
ncbi:TetR/AcrR family transcriptional regulator [Desulfobotulus sp. H1]|uniref:TetR/AcrR family transcriptional regulator n=1 Tax=Desulfobotulus pelophilus TaxID=2823377 RepID=A0ABT3N8A1_9BACT|nr:TetR/AcrR family transcriptional regulator [Desulfobotulus pelophilus]MCW7753685.1 TetR/AcrR family transcriptional regulator [Desulfobotulus pelophilus]